MKKIPDYPGLVPLDLSFKEELEAVFKALQPLNSEFSTGNMFCYAETINLLAAKINGNICFTGKYRGHRFFTSPIGENRVKETIDLCLTQMKELHNGGRISLVTEDRAALFLNDARYQVIDSRDDYDYVYSTEELAALPGEKFHAKKNLLNQFLKKYRHEYLPLSAELAGECLRLQEDWCNLRKCHEVETLAAENDCINELLKNYEILNVFGGVIKVEGKIQAFTIQEELNKTTAVTHIEKGNTDFKGIYQAINNYTAKSLLGRFEFINREQDLGEPGLRKAKLSYNPVKMVKKYYISLA